MEESNEFRCFFCNGKLTAASVYAHDLEASKKWNTLEEWELTALMRKVQSVWDEKNLPWKNAIMDIYVDFDSFKIEVSIFWLYA